MKTRPYTFARTLILALFFTAGPAFAQGDVVEGIGAIIDSISEGIQRIGEKSEDLIAPGLRSIGETVFDESGLMTASDEHRQNVPVAANVTISIEHEFGEVYISTWDDPVVRIETSVHVGAETAERARQVADGIKVIVDAADPERLDLRTQYPPVDATTVVTEVLYRITVPRGASVLTDTRFGDVIIRELDGDVAINSQYGAINLMAIKGKVTVHARGEYPLYASDLTGGAEFELIGLAAEIKDVTGALTVSNYMGSLDVGGTTHATSVDLRSRNGALHFRIPEGDGPALSATALFGEIHSDMPLEMSVRRNATLGHSTPSNGRQDVTLYAAFADVYIHQDGADGRNPLAVAASESVKGEVARVLPFAPGSELIVDATAGNVLIEGIDGDTVQVIGEQVVQVTAKGQAAAALEALVVDVTQTEQGLRVQSRVQADLDALGGLYHRIDLRIQCPRDAILTVRAASGRTRITGVAGSVHVNQSQGSITAEHGDGSMDVTIASGDVTALDMAGQVSIRAAGGEVLTRNVRGKQTIRGESAAVVIDAPNGALDVENVDGDVRIIALDGIHDDYSVTVRDGTISLVQPESASAEFVVKVEGGAVDSVVPLAGTHSRSRQDYIGRTNEGAHRVALTATNGNVIID
jgi:hypothetical protein